MIDNPVRGVKALDASSRFIEHMSIEELADILKVAGYRVTTAEQNGITQLMSASQGVGFVVRPGNAVQPNAVQATAANVIEAPVYLDYTLSCTMQVQGELPAELALSWNRTKRFARLAEHAPFLVLEMDVVVAGGVSTRHLQSMVELWDRLIQEFLLHLRNRPSMAAAQKLAATINSAKPDRSMSAETKGSPKAGSQ